MEDPAAVMPNPNRREEQAPEVVLTQHPPIVYHPESKYASGVGVAEPEKKRKCICGLPPSSFWLAVALVSVIIAAAIGGGVGGSLAVANAKKARQAQEKPDSCSNSTSNPVHTSSETASSTGTGTSSEAASSTTSYFVAPTDVLISLDCDKGPEQSVRVDDREWVYRTQCNTDRTGGDMFGVITYSMHDCLVACANYNIHFGSGCTGIVFASDMQTWVSSQWATCYLKNATMDTRSVAGLTAAVLI